MPRYPFTASEQSIAIFFNGKLHSIPSTHAAFADLYEHLKLPEHDPQEIEGLIDQPKRIARLTEGLVSVVGNTVFYAGNPVHGALTERLLNLLDAGFDVTPWARFLDRLMLNPSERSRQCLFNFLDHFAAPFTEDGHFLAFKYVRNDYKDAYTGTMDNSPGKIVEMPREQVDDDPHNTCSRGLHACASSYLGGYARNNRVVVVKIDPKDVVAVPVDYNFSKMRVCRYEVLCDMEDTGMTVSEYEQQQVVTSAPSASPEPEVRPGRLTKEEFDAEWVVDDSIVPEDGGKVAQIDYEDDGTPVYYIGTINSFSMERDRTGEVEYTLDVEFDDEEWAAAEDGDFEYSPDFPHRNEIELIRKKADEEKSNVPGPAAALSGYDSHPDEPEEEEEEPEEETNGDTEPTELVFLRAGRHWSASEIKAGVDKHGQRAYSNLTGIPRATLQGWLNKINGNGQH